MTFFIGFGFCLMIWYLAYWKISFYLKLSGLAVSFFLSREGKPLTILDGLFGAGLVEMLL